MLGSGRKPQDGDRKIFQVGFGMVTGAGSPAMIKAVIDKALELKLTPPEIPHWMQRFQEQVKVEHPDLEEGAVNSLEQTQVIVTSVERAPSGLADSKVVAIARTGDENFECDEIRMGAAAICGPTRNAAWEAWIARCQAHITVPQTVRMERACHPEELVAAIEANIQLAAEVMAEIASATVAVSPTFTVGVQYSPTEVRISGPHERPPDPAWLR